MTMLPRITIVTPSYNQAAFLRRTLASIHDQAYPNLEHIVIDGGSTDGSTDIIGEYAPRLAYWVSERDRGQSDAINKGFARATGAVLTWLNSDDVLLPGALRAVGQIFAQYPAIDWLTGRPANIDAADALRVFPQRVGRLRGWIRRGWYHGRAWGFIRQEGTFWRCSLWQRVGAAVDEARHYTMDYDLWRRLAAHADLVTVDQPLAAYRSHGVQKTADLAPYYAEAGITLPPATRWIMLPARAGLSPLLWYAAPRVIATATGWQYVRPAFA